MTRPFDIDVLAVDATHLHNLIDIAGDLCGDLPRVLSDGTRDYRTDQLDSILSVAATYAKVLADRIDALPRTG